MSVAHLNLIDAVETLGYEVTVADVAARSGWSLAETRQGLLALASDTGGNLQVSELGDIVYQFPKDLRGVLQRKFWRLRWQKIGAQVWRVVFYLIRISFATILVLSLILIVVAIAIIVVSLQSANDSDSGGGRRSWGFFWFPWDIFDIFWLFSPNNYYRNRRIRSGKSKRKMNFFESVFSFLFGDGNPNRNLEERRWQAIAASIRTHQGAVVAEHLAPYLDDLGQGYHREYDNYLLPVLAKFNGLPEVTPEGGLVYQFPDLQVTANQTIETNYPTYLKEQKWKFSSASSSQVMLAIGLGAANLIGALVLGSLLADGQIAAQLGGLVALVASIYPILLGYGIGFLAIPLVRYLWLNSANEKIEKRNRDREKQASALQQPNPTLQRKLDYAKQLETDLTVASDNPIYTTETDLLEQEIDRLPEERS